MIKNKSLPYKKNIYIPLINVILIIIPFPYILPFLSTTLTVLIKLMSQGNKKMYGPFVTQNRYTMMLQNIRATFLY